jgi:hypothetical protein
MKNLIKDIINKIKIPSLLSFFITKDGKVNPSKKEIYKDAPNPLTNWDRLGLEKNIKYFEPIVVIPSLYFLKSFIIRLIDFKSKFDIIGFNGDGSPITIAYQANSVIFLVDNGFMVIGVIYLVYFGYKLFKK